MSLNWPYARAGPSADQRLAFTAQIEAFEQQSHTILLWQTMEALIKIQLIFLFTINAH